jgi:hypothetical protein
MLSVASLDRVLGEEKVGMRFFSQSKLLLARRNAHSLLPLGVHTEACAHTLLPCSPRIGGFNSMQGRRWGFAGPRRLPQYRVENASWSAKPQSAAL